jgi:hypothetical protein
LVEAAEHGAREGPGQGTESPVSLQSAMLETLSAWRQLLAGTVGGLVLGLVVLWVVQPQYTAMMLVAPTTRMAPSGMGPLQPPLTSGSGKAMSEPGPGELLSDFARYVELLSSIPVAERLVRDPRIATRIFEREWDSEAQEWRPPRHALALVRRAVYWLSGRESWSPPDAERLREYFRRNLEVGSTPTGPLRRIAFRHEDHAFALFLIQAVHDTADRLIRDEARRRTEAQISYLRQRTVTATDVAHRTALGDLLRDQERIRMMLDVHLPYAADIISPASAATLPDWPDPPRLLAVFGIAGLMISLLILYGRGLWTRPLW